jgi:hypothetical protein
MIEIEVVACNSQRWGENNKWPNVPQEKTGFLELRLDQWSRPMNLQQDWFDCQRFPDVQCAARKISFGIPALSTFTDAAQPITIRV